MELGFALIDQVEEIAEETIDILASRLNLGVSPQRQIIMTCNPALFWAYRRFKQEKHPDYELIEFSMLENKHNLPEDYFSDMLQRPESWKRQFVYGIWDESLLSERAVFPVEYIQQQDKFIIPPQRKIDDIDIYEDVVERHTYQAGVDISEGIGRDYSVLSIWNTVTGEQVAFWRGQIAPDMLAQKVIPCLRYYNEALVVPEINGLGLAFLSRLKEKYDNIYHRVDFDKDKEIERQLLGWKTTHATKPLLVDNFMTLLREGKIKIRNRQILEEMKTYIWTDEVRKKGSGAQQGFYDDSIISAMLACWKITPGQIQPGINMDLSHFFTGGRAGY